MTLVLLRVSPRIARSRSPSPRRIRSRSPSPLPLRSCSPGRARSTNASRHAFLVARFGDIYSKDRFDAERILRTYISDMEMVQRIIYTAAVVRKENISHFIKYYGWIGLRCVCEVQKRKFLIFLLLPSHFYIKLS